MKISDQISLSVSNLSRRKGRTALTIIGVIIGTCAVIVMISLGIAQNAATDAMLQSWGDLTMIEVYSGGISYSSDTGEQVSLNQEAVEAFRGLEHVIAASPYEQDYEMNVSITAGRNNRYENTGSYNLFGIDPEAMPLLGNELESGSWPTDGTTYGKDVIPVVVGPYFAYNFQDTRRSVNSTKRYRWYGETDSFGNLLDPYVDVSRDDLTLTLNDGEESGGKSVSYKIKVVGVLKEDSKNYQLQYGMIMRLSDMQMLKTQNAKLNKTGYNVKTSTYNTVYVKVDDMNNVDGVSEIIKDEMGFSVYSMSDERKSMQQQVARQQLMLGGLAAISLFVAALNIANTMTMAIYERRREIGVMKVLGCELGSIRRMFLLESGMIGFIGGVIGAALSYLVSFVLNNITVIVYGLTNALQSIGIHVSLDVSSLISGSYSYYTDSTTISTIPPWLVLAALAFAVVIGLASGLAPADRAVKISALEAIRNN